MVKVLYNEHIFWTYFLNIFSEHIFSLCTILRNRKSQNKSTYLAILDSEKAFHHVDRDLLLYKLLRIEIKGHIYESIKNIYQNSYCSVNVNNMLTDWFNTKAGVEQGDSLSPTMFGIFINDINCWRCKVCQYRHRDWWS